MADARKLMPFILQWEGGFVNDPLDRGGATNKGVTIGTFQSFYPGATVENLKRITDDQWLTIFKGGYWNPWQADQIKNQAVANIVVDWAWASGARTAIRKVQELLGVSVDGLVGNETLSAINSQDAEELFDRIKVARYDFVDAIVKRDPSQKRFINGWKNRINSIKYEK